MFEYRSSVGMWDPDMIRRGDEFHLFHLQGIELPAGHPDQNTIGHAVSRDLYHWTEQPVALRKNEAGAWDGGGYGHFNVFEWSGRYYMYYTAKSGRPGDVWDKIGLAESDDLYEWRRYQENPILVPDPRWYESPQDADYRKAWRDPFVYHDPETGKFYMFLVGRVREADKQVRGCIACAVSEDLHRWHCREPVYWPKRFHDLEVPSVFRQDGRYYLIYHAPYLGGPSNYRTTDPYQSSGIWYATSEALLTGYSSPEDEVLLSRWAAEPSTVRMFSGRSIAVDGTRWLYYWIHRHPVGSDRSDRNDCVFPPPKPLLLRADRALEVGYDCGQERFASQSILQGPEPSVRQAADQTGGTWRVTGVALVGRAQAGSSALVLPQQCAGGIFAARVTVPSEGRAGLVIRANEQGSDGIAALLDAREQRVCLEMLGKDELIDQRRHQMAPSGTAEIKTVFRGEFIEVYVDDRLRLHNVRHVPALGRLGFVAMGTEARFTAMWAKSF